MKQKGSNGGADMKNRKMVGVIGVVLVVIAVFAVVVFAMRGIDADNDRKISDDLSEIAWKIYDYSLENEALPPDLDAVRERLPKLNRALEKYSYQIVDEHSYRICTDGFVSDTKDYEGAPDGYNDYDRNWGVHDSGWSCWEPEEYWDESAKKLYEFRKNESNG